MREEKERKKEGASKSIESEDTLQCVLVPLDIQAWRDPCRCRPVPWCPFPLLGLLAVPEAVHGLQHDLLELPVHVKQLLKVARSRLAPLSFEFVCNLADLHARCHDDTFQGWDGGVDLVEFGTNLDADDWVGKEGAEVGEGFLSGISGG